MCFQSSLYCLGRCSVQHSPRGKSAPHSVQPTGFAQPVPLPNAVAGSRLEPSGAAVPPALQHPKQIRPDVLPGYHLCCFTLLTSLAHSVWRLIAFSRNKSLGSSRNRKYSILFSSKERQGQKTPSIWAARLCSSLGCSASGLDFCTLCPRETDLGSSQKVFHYSAAKMSNLTSLCYLTFLQSKPSLSCLFRRCMHDVML